MSESKPTETELLPCPFDGSTATRMRVVTGHWLVECDSCGVSTPHDGFCDPDKVWNTRTPSPPPSSAEARARARDIVGASLCGHDDCPNADAVHTSELVDRIASALSTPHHLPLQLKEEK